MTKWIGPLLRAHLLTTRKRAVVLPDGSRALSEGDTSAGSRPAGSTEAGGRQGTGYALPMAPLTASSFSALRQPRGAYAPLFSKSVLLGKKALDKSLTGSIWSYSRPVTHHRGSNAHTEG